MLKGEEKTSDIDIASNSSSEDVGTRSADIFST